MKRIVSMILALVMTVFLAACDSSMNDFIAEGSLLAHMCTLAKRCVFAGQRV